MGDPIEYLYDGTHDARGYRKRNENSQPARRGCDIKIPLWIFKR